MCGGENGLYETKVFYFKRPDDPDNFYSKNISVYGDWCKPIDQIYMPECPECRRYWRSGVYKDRKLITDLYKIKLNEKYETIKRYEKKYKMVYHNSKKENPYYIDANRVREKNKKYKKALEEITKKLTYLRSCVYQYEYMVRQYQNEIDFYISPIKDAIEGEQWKTELKTFYGLD